MQTNNKIMIIDNLSRIKNTLNVTLHLLTKENAGGNEFNGRTCENLFESFGEVNEIVKQIEKIIGTTKWRIHGGEQEGKVK